MDLNLDRIGLIDSLYIDRDHVYTVGEQVTAFLTHFDVGKNEYILRPPDQVPIAERIDFAKLQESDPTAWWGPVRPDEY